MPAAQWDATWVAIGRDAKLSLGRNPTWSHEYIRSFKANRPVARRSCSKNWWENMRSARTHEKWKRNDLYYKTVPHSIAHNGGGNPLLRSCWWWHVLQRAAKPTSHVTQLPAFGSKPMKKYVSYQWKPCKVKMFSCSATKKWIKTNNLRSLREEKRYQKQQETHLHEKLLKKHLLNLFELSITIT